MNPRQERQPAPCEIVPFPLHGLLLRRGSSLRLPERHWEAPEQIRQEPRAPRNLTPLYRDALERQAPGTGLLVSLPLNLGVAPGGDVFRDRRPAEWRPTWARFLHGGPTATRPPASRGVDRQTILGPGSAPSSATGRRSTSNGTRHGSSGSTPCRRRSAPRPRTSSTPGPISGGNGTSHLPNCIETVCAIRPCEIRKAFLEKRIRALT
jgi:hypothetical protein